MNELTITQPAAVAAQPFTAYFPLVPNGKMPAVKRWQETQPGQVRPSGNVGINMQPTEIVIDVDAYKPEGKVSLSKLSAACPKLAETYVVKTPRGGYHFYLFVPAGTKLKQKQSAYPGVEFQCAGRYVVGAGSKTPDGEYTIANYQPVIQLPNALLDTLEVQKGRDDEDRANQPNPSLAGESQFISACQTHPEAIQGQHGSTPTFQLAAFGARDLNLPLEAVFSHMRDTYNLRCQPPWTDAELWHKVEDGYKDGKNPIGCALASSKFAPAAVTVENAPVQPSEPPTFEVPTTGEHNHKGNAARLAREYGHHLRWCKQKNAWLVWNGRYWEVDNKERPTAFVMKMVGQMCVESAGSDESRKFALSSGQAPSVRSTLDLAKAYLPITADELDQKLHMLNCKNGTLDLRTGELHKHNPMDFNTRYIDVDYDPEASAPHWEKFISDIFPNSEMARFAQRAVGSAISGRGSVINQKLFIAYGDGQNGKSTFFNALHDVLGGYAHETDHALLTAPKQRGPNEGMSNLKGVRLATTIETAEDDWLNETTVKQLTGGDLITTNAKYEKQITFKPTHTLFMVTNHLPGVKTQGFAVWRRILPIPFTVRIADDKKDPRLLEKLQTERAGILAWIVRGHHEWLKSGLQPPPEVLVATKEYMVDQDALGPFLQSACEIDTSARTQASLMFKEYKAYCGLNGIDKTLNRDSFPKRMAEKFKRVETNGLVYWVGIKLKPAGSEIGNVFAAHVPPRLKSWDELI